MSFVDGLIIRGEKKIPLKSSMSGEKSSWQLYLIEILKNQAAEPGRKNWQLLANVFPHFISLHLHLELVSKNITQVKPQSVICLSSENVSK